MRRNGGKDLNFSYKMKGLHVAVLNSALNWPHSNIHKYSIRTRARRGQNMPAFAPRVGPSGVSPQQASTLSTPANTSKKRSSTSNVYIIVIY
ncbi:jg7074 [Pararge aegeria aegeria]|uniref:Jg7074 protein n=1 Tax=Pararge aegeria aegeria TaxID=348720 RepID=A0A8S4QR50_9NEOP|nr:jg7074 [Pararge aegeria aegeria]